MLYTGSREAKCLPSGGLHSGGQPLPCLFLRLHPAYMNAMAPLMIRAQLFHQEDMTLRDPRKHLCAQHQLGTVHGFISPPYQYKTHDNSDCQTINPLQLS